MTEIPYISEELRRKIRLLNNDAISNKYPEHCISCDEEEQIISNNEKAEILDELLGSRFRNNSDVEYLKKCLLDDKKELIKNNEIVKRFINYYQQRGSSCDLVYDIIEECFGGISNLKSILEKN